MTRKKQIDEFVNVDNKVDLIKIESFDNIPLSRYFFNPITKDILLFLPISNRYKLVKPTKSIVKGHAYDVISLIPSDNSKRIRKPYHSVMFCVI